MTFYRRLANGLGGWLSDDQGAVLAAVAALTSGTGYLQKSGPNPEDWSLGAGAGAGNIDGGFANSTYTAAQSINGGRS